MNTTNIANLLKAYFISIVKKITILISLNFLFFIFQIYTYY